MARLRRIACLPLALAAVALAAPLAMAQASSGADLAITKQDSPDPVTLGQQVTFFLNVTNNGPRTNANGVTITDTFPSAYTILSMSTGCSRVGNAVTCDLGNVATGAPEGVVIVVRADTAGVHENTATVQGNNPDPATSNNAATASTSVRTAPPEDLTCVAESGRIRLDWNDVDQATGYNVYRATGSGSFVPLDTTASSSYDDTTAAAGQTYRYRVTSLSDGGESGPSEECTAMAIPFFLSLMAALVATAAIVGVVRLLRRR